MWMTRPPVLSMRAAAAITSIAMNGGTSLRAEGSVGMLAVTAFATPVQTFAAKLGYRVVNPLGETPPRCCRNFPLSPCGFPQQDVNARMLTASGRVPSLQTTGRNETRFLMIASERRISQRHMTPASRAIALLTAGALLATSGPLRAQENPTSGLPIIRDSEIEQLLRDYSQPILRAAGLTSQNIRVVIINNRAFNAFVADGKHIFINAGALMDSRTPNQVIGVLAHETGHIAGGHLIKLHEELAHAQTTSVI